MKLNWVTLLVAGQFVIDALFRWYYNIVVNDFLRFHGNVLDRAASNFDLAIIDAFSKPIMVAITGGMASGIGLVVVTSKFVSVGVIVCSLYSKYGSGIYTLLVRSKLILALFVAWIEPWVSLISVGQNLVMGEMLHLREFLASTTSIATHAPLLTAFLGLPFAIMTTIIWLIGNQLMKFSFFRTQ